MLIVLAIWSATDVRWRARLDPQRPTVHRTDFTVYTAAGEAFFDGRDPYQVTNARGWRYLYLPMFAILVAPLAALPPELQAVVWFWVSLAAGWGSWLELKRLGRRAPSSATDATRQPTDWTRYAGILAAATVALPVLNSLQRGQVGLVQLYLTLLGFRLWSERRSRWTLFAAGIVLAEAAILKLTPLVPIACLGLFDLVRAARSRRSPSVHRLGWSSGGLVAGLAIGLFLAPAAFIGWSANLRHLGTWWTTVGNQVAEPTYDQFAGDSHSARNQSLANALWLIGNGVEWAIAGQRIATPDPAAQVSPVMDSTAARVAIDAARWLLLLATLLAVARLAIAAERMTPTDELGQRDAAAPAMTRPAASCRRADAIPERICFALGCSASLLLPSIARVHYFMALLPGLLWLPPWLASAGYPRLSRAASLAPFVLTVAHYAAMPVAGNLGLLGVGIAIWHLTIVGLIASRFTATAEHESRAAPALARAA